MISIRSVLVNTTGTFISRVLGLFKNIVVNFYFGLVDVFWASFQIINVLRNLVGEGAINNVFIPIYNKVKIEKPEFLKTFVLKNMFIIFLVSNFLSILLIIFSYQLSVVFFPGFADEWISISSISISIMAFSVTFISLQSFLAIVKIGEGEYFSFAYSPVIFNIVFIAILALFQEKGYYILPWAVLVGSFSMLVFQILWSVRSVKDFLAVKVSIRELFKMDSYTRQLMISYFSVFGIYLISQINSLVSRFFGSFYEGFITAMTNAFLVIQVPIGMFGVAISLVGLGHLSKYFSENDLIGFRATSKQALEFFNFIILPISIFFMVFSFELTRFVFRDIPGILMGSPGKYDLEALNLTHEAFWVYSFCIYFQGFLLILTRVSYARGNVKIPIVNSLTVLIGNVVFNVIFFVFFRWYQGIVWAYFISLTFASLHIFLIEKNYIADKLKVFVEFLKISGISFLVAVSIKIIFSLFNFGDGYWESFLATTVKGVLFLVIFIFLSAVAKVDVFWYLWRKFLKNFS